MIWEKKIGQGLLENTPVIDSMGTIYWSLSEKLYTIDKNGAVTCLFDPPGEAGVILNPSIASNGLLYVHVTGGYLVCMTRNGEEQWRTMITGYALGAPIIGACGNIIQHSLLDNSQVGRSAIEVFSPDGILLNAIEIEGSANSIISAADGVIYAISYQLSLESTPSWNLFRIE